MPVAARRKVSGIHPDRADVIVAGALVYRWLLRRAERDGLWISGYGVREGAFLERFLPAPHLETDVRRFSVDNLFRCYPQPAGHTANVRRLAGLLFDGLMPLHGLAPEARELLDAAAVLHDVGMAVGYHNHHKHGAYLVETSRMLNGFSHREVALLTLLVRYHRKGTPRWPSRWSEGPQKLTAPGDKLLLLYLTVCLRLAEYLERARAGRVEDVKVWIAKDEVVLELWAHEEPAVEIWEARKHAPLFEQAFSRRLVLRRSDTATLPEAPPS
jgi:exopolyphosphatase/guanosine-5'-triphosphate,3'-diphosphate pyrophosphatase